MLEKLLLCLVSGFLCPILLETWREIIKRRRERAEKADKSGEATTVAPEPPVTQAVSDPVPVPVVSPVVPPLVTGASNSTQTTFDPAAGVSRIRKWPWILLSIVSGLVLGPIVALLICALGKFCTGNFLPYILVSMAVCASAIWFLIRIALLPAHGTALKRATRIGLRIVVSALIGPSLGIIVALVIAVTTGQKDFSTPGFIFVFSSIACTILLWLGLNRRGPLRARTRGSVVTS